MEYKWIKEPEGWVRLQKGVLGSWNRLGYYAREPRLKTPKEIKELSSRKNKYGKNIKNKRKLIWDDKWFCIFYDSPNGNPINLEEVQKQSDERISLVVRKAPGDFI